MLEGQEEAPHMASTDTMQVWVALLSLGGDESPDFLLGLYWQHLSKED